VTANLDDLVARYLDLTEQIEHLDNERAAVKAQLRDAGPGRHATTYGVTVTVAANRRFDIDAAWTMLTPEQQALCVSPDAKKVRAQLAPALVESLMADAGEPRVTVR
jgi:hypothetical protein